MVRWVSMLVAFTVLAAWAGAQNPVAQTLSPEDKLRLLRTNSALLDDLVRDGVAMSATSDPVQRAVRCREASLSLVAAVGEAARAEDAERVAELTGLFREVVRDGLVPTMNEARQSVPPQSPGAQKLRDLQTLATNDVSGLKTAIPASGKVGDNPRVKDARKQLDELTEALK
jgi:hypothetical protein